MSHVPPPPPPPYSPYGPQSGNAGYPPPPPPTGYPPGQYAAQGYPPGGGFYPPQPTRGNGAAATSLVCGLLMCIPFATGLVAIVTGLVGLKNARQPGRTGAGLAMFGLILGALNLVVWGAGTPRMIAFGKSVYGKVAAQNDEARQFLRDLSAGNVDAAAAKCHTTMPKAALEEAAQTIKPWGAFQDASVSSVNVQQSTGRPESWLIEGTAKFATAERKFKVEFGKENGKWVIVEYNLKP